MKSWNCPPRRASHMDSTAPSDAGRRTEAAQRASAERGAARARDIAVPLHCEINVREKRKKKRNPRSSCAAEQSGGVVGWGQTDLELLDVSPRIPALPESEPLPWPPHAHVSTGHASKRAQEV
eukprot:3212723-Rhodomonas_salina.1